MNARMVSTAAVVTVIAAWVPAHAADAQLVKLLPADAKVVAGVNVNQAKGSPLGQYVLSQIGVDNKGLKDVIQQTGFDPTRDVYEVLAVASVDPGTTDASKHVSGAKGSGLVLALGNFNIAGITLAATQHQAATETYKGVTIIEDPNHESGTAFLSASVVAAGDLANVKAAIDRQSAPAAVPASLLSQINQWSSSTDAWVITTVPPSTLTIPKGAPNVPGVGANANALTNVQRAAAGVQLGVQVTVKAEAVADNAQDAQQMADGLKLLVSIAQMQGNTDPAVTALFQNLTIAAQGNLLNVTASLPSDQLQKLVAPKKIVPAARRAQIQK
jgi:hypothetical protein